MIHQINDEVVLKLSGIIDKIELWPDNTVRYTIRTKNYEFAMVKEDKISWRMVKCQICDKSFPYEGPANANMIFTCDDCNKGIMESESPKD